ncbi:MAG: AAA family ATPase [Rhodospirillales bacterium]|nr:AAA family ATPase [Rhodospirillales bacterium]
MSEGDKSYTSVLLPGARVELFSNDPQTKEVFLSLSQDWRFARVELEAYDGDVEAAIQSYATVEAPDLVIIQTETIDDSFSGRLGALAANCNEGTSAIVIGPDNDVNLYRKLVGMGVSDYLVKPVEAVTFSNDIASTLLEQVGARDSRLIAVLGAKGGVGASTVAQSVAWALADDLGQKTFLMDAAGGWSTLNVGMDFDPSTTLVEAGRAAAEGNEDSLTRMIYNASDKLFVLSSGGDVMMDDSVSAENYEALIDYVTITHPFLVVDLSGAPSALCRTVLTKAHDILLITSPELASVRAARTLSHEIKDLRGGSHDDVSLVLNMKGISPKHEVSKAQIEEGIDKKIAAEIAFSPDVFLAAESQAEKLSVTKGGDVLIANLLLLVRRIAGGAAEKEEKVDEKGGIGSFLNKLTKKS